MARGNRVSRPAVVAAELDAEVKRIGSLKIDELRSLWTETFRKDVPPGLTKDLLARMLAWHVQERAFGGIDRATLKLLDGYAHGKPADLERFRRFKPGSELVREYRGERHIVVVAADGFEWRGVTYGSLTMIARAITGSNWNGPRFFGLREGRGGAPAPEASQPAKPRTAKRSKGAAR